MTSDEIDVKIQIGRGQVVVELTHCGHSFWMRYKWEKETLPSIFRCLCFLQKVGWHLWREDPTWQPLESEQLQSLTRILASYHA